MLIACVRPRTLPPLIAGFNTCAPLKTSHGTFNSTARGNTSGLQSLSRLALSMSCQREVVP
jgi:hypothetical protein